MTMSYLQVDEQGNLLTIYNENGEGLLTRKVPEDYPGTVEWDAASLSFKSSVQKLRQVKIARLKELRDAAEFGVISTPQGELQIDERSQGRMQRALELGRTYERLTGEPFSTAWRMYDNSLVPIGISHLEGWSLLIGANVQHSFSRYAELYAQVEDTTTIAQLEALNIEEGWNV